MHSALPLPKQAVDFKQIALALRSAGEPSG